MSANALVDIQELLPAQEEIKKFITEMQLFAENLDVTTEPSFKKITSIYADAKNWEKIIEQKRKEANIPEQTIINARNDRAKQIVEPLRVIQSICKRKADEYQRHIEQERKNTQQKLEDAAAMFDTAVPSLPGAPSIHRGTGAIAYATTKTRFKLQDLTKVPFKYLMLDEARVRLDIEHGIRNISGIEIYEEKTTTLKTRP